MAREIMLSDGRTALFDDDATEQDIENKLKAKNLTRATGPVAPAAAAEPIPGGMPAAAGLSAVNSLMFGVPELIARGFGAGPAIEATRTEYPFMTTAGDVVGLLNPARLGMKMAGKGMSALGERMMTRPGSEAGQEAVMETLRTGRTPQLIGTAVKRGAQAAGGVVGAQVGATALGGARDPADEGFFRGFYGPAGAERGAQVFREAAMSAPGTGLVPGLQTTIGAVTTPVPAAIGYGSAAFNIALERQMREEAARRALQGR